MNKRIIIEIVTYLYVVLFLYTGIEKFIDFEGFRNTISNAAPIHTFAPFLSWAVPLTEFAIVVLLIYPNWRIYGLYAGGSLMAIFTIYISYMFISHSHLPCSCGGVIKLMNWHQHLYFNSGFVLMAVLSIIIDQRYDIDQEQSSKLKYQIP